MIRNRALPVGVLLLLMGCEYRGADSLPLPGAEGGGDTYPVTAVFSDATNLVAKETCRANDTVIGSIESVELDEELNAEVVCRIRDEIELPANVTATIRETSLLGERFVSLDVPDGQQPTGVLPAGATLPAATARVDPNTEMVLGALSQVLNGGGLANIETITRELTAALEGSNLGATVDGLNGVVGPLNENRLQITATLDSLDTLTRTLARQRRVIGSALDTIPDGLAVLDRQRPRLVALLRGLSDLSATALPLIERSRANTVADLEHLDPVLEELASAGDELARTVERISTFPQEGNLLTFFRGDYAGIYIDLEVGVDSLNALLGGAGTIPIEETPSIAPGPQAEDPTGLSDLEFPIDIPGIDISTLDSTLVNLLRDEAR